VSAAVFDSLPALLGAPPMELGASAWATVSEADIDAFGRAVGTGPSPYLALSLTNRFLPELLQVPAAASGVNYGAESARFGAPLQAGDRVRASARLVSAGAVPGGIQTVVEISVEVDGADEAACVVRSLSRWLS